MIKSSSDNTTPRWKRSAVKGTLIGVRLQPDRLKALDKWSKGILTRPEAIRQLVEAALTPCISSEQAAAIDAWIRKQADPDLTRPEAISRLVELGLTVRTKSKQPTAARAHRAKELAATAIDSLTAGAPNNDEKASRKRRLIKGPEEFREVRLDRAKGK